MSGGPKDAVQVRVDMINGHFELSEETVQFMNFVRTASAEFAQQMVARAPATCDIGRLIAAVDHIQATKNLFCDAAILGNETDSRKKRKAAEAEKKE